MTIKMVCPRNFTLRTQSGHTIHFEAGKPKDVPDMLYAEALRFNIVPVKGAHVDDDDGTGQPRVQITGSLRDALIYGAMHEIVTRNSPDDFDGGRQPKPKAIEDITGIKISAQERTKYWDNYREIIGSNQELPTHSNVQSIQDLNTMRSQKDLLAFAEERGYDLNKLKGKNNRDLKEAILGQLIMERNAPVQSDKPSTLVED